MPKRGPIGAARILGTWLTGGQGRWTAEIEGE